MFVFTSEPTPDRVSRALALGERFRIAAARRREVDVEMAKILAELAGLGSWHVVGCASPGQFGERCAISARDARMLLDFGNAMVAAPEIEMQVREGRITVEAAGCVGEVLATPALMRSDDDWVHWARTESTKGLRGRVQKRKEEARLGGDPAFPLTVYVPQRARDDFAKARAVASRRAGHMVTPGETFEVVTRHYLDTFDEERASPGTRRAAPTTFVKGRYVPRAVRREVYRRQQGRCAVPFCGSSIFVEMAHLVAHRFGGDREAGNLLLLCSAHHRDFDDGWLTVTGAASDPRFLDRSGNDLALRFERGRVGPPRGAAGVGSDWQRPEDARPEAPDEPNGGPAPNPGTSKPEAGGQPPESGAAPGGPDPP